MNRLDKMKVGSYEPIEMSKDEIKKRRGKENIWWDVHLGRGNGFFTKTQFEAEVISRLERIERQLKKLKIKA